MIQARTLTMHYGPVVALKGVSFNARKGEILGLLGPNGAGKTTLMRLLTTFLYPTSGTAVVEGHDIKVAPLSVRASIGYLPEAVPLYSDMLVEEYLRFVGNARGLYGGRLSERLEWVRKSCGLRPVWRHIIYEISKGFRQRLGLAQALIHDPKVLILDEPTSALDPLQIIDIRRLIRSFAKDKTIIFSTHILQEVEAVADRIAIINNGRLVANGTRDELVQRAKKAERIVIAVRAQRSEVEAALTGLGIVDEMRFLGNLDGGYVRFWLRSLKERPLMQMVDELVRARSWPLREFTREEASLEEVFITLLNQSAERAG